MACSGLKVISMTTQANYPILKEIHKEVRIFPLKVQITAKSIGAVGTTMFSRIIDRPGPAMSLGANFVFVIAAPGYLPI